MPKCVATHSLADAHPALTHELQLSAQLADIKRTMKQLHEDSLSQMRVELDCLRRELGARGKPYSLELRSPLQPADHPISPPRSQFFEQVSEAEILGETCEHSEASANHMATVDTFKATQLVAQEMQIWAQKEKQHRHHMASSREFETPVRESTCRLYAERLANSQGFDMAMCLVIFINCITLGAEVQLFADDPGADLPSAIGAIDSIIFVLFLVELLVRVAARGLKPFFCSGPSLGWNYFDTFVVAMSIFDLVGHVLMSFGGSSVDVANMRIFRIIKVVRLSRVVRAARVIRYVSALRMLIYSMVVSLRSVMWALLLFTLIIYVCAIVFTQEVAQSVFDHGSVDETDARIVYWGSIYSSMFTLYKSICGGVDWHVVVVPLQEIHLSLALLFAMFIWFMYFVALNVITGVFCSTAQSAAASDPEIIAMGLQVSKATRQLHAKKLFGAIDEDDSGHVTISELTSRLDDVDVQGLFMAIGVDSSDAIALFSVLDVDKSGLVDSSEFVHGCISLRGAVSNVDFVRASTETRCMLNRLDEIMAALEKFIGKEGPRPAERWASLV